MDHKFNLTDPSMQYCIRMRLEALHCSGLVKAETGEGGESEESLSTWAQKIVWWHFPSSSISSPSPRALFIVPETSEVSLLLHRITLLIL